MLRSHFAIAPRRLHLYKCGTTHAQAAIGMLAQLTQLGSLSLGVHSCDGSELDDDYPDLDGWDQFAQLPPLGSLTAITELWLAGLAALPPDFRQLSSMRRLTTAAVYGEDFSPLNWGAESLAGLVSLTRMEVQVHRWPLPAPPGETLGIKLPVECLCITLLRRTGGSIATAPTPADPAVLASAPRLAELHAPGSSADWRARLAALRPDVAITPAPQPPAAAQP